MVKTLRAFLGEDVMMTVTPPTFIVRPKEGMNPQNDERRLFADAFNQAAKDSVHRNVWIVKSSHGCKGQGIELFTNVQSALHFVDSSPDPFPFVVQKYIENPFLINGRKFDIRTWVLLTPHYDIHIYREGVLRTSSEQYSDDLHHTLAHLTNHCIQETGVHFGAYEKGNEMWYSEFQNYLDAIHCGLNFRERVVSQMKSISIQCLLAVKSALQTSCKVNSTALHCFQLFGFDFMLDADFDVWLIEVNGSPAVAKALQDSVVTDLVKLVVDPLFSPQQNVMNSSSPLCNNFCHPEDNNSSNNINGFDLIYRNKSRRY
jgi:tubulin--tyrosine ligase